MPRVVSLVPSATEILCLIGGEQLLVGRSHECDYPASIIDRPILTSARTHFDSGGSAAIDTAVRAALSAGQPLYTLDTALLADLAPDLIITQDLCHVCSIDLAAVRAIAAQLPSRPRILSLNPETLEDVFDDILRVGEATGLNAGAESALIDLRSRLYAAGDYVTPYLTGPTVAFLEWLDPIYIGGHWTPQLIERAGGAHPLNPTVAINNAGAAAGPVGSTLRRAGKSIRVPIDLLLASRPDRIIVSPCGLSLSQAQAEVDRLAHESAWWRELTARRGVRTAIVDGNQMFSRPGPRLIDAFEWLVAWLNDRPELAPLTFPCHEVAL